MKVGKTSANSCYLIYPITAAPEFWVSWSITASSDPGPTELAGVSNDPDDLPFILSYYIFMNEKPLDSQILVRFESLSLQNSILQVNLLILKVNIRDGRKDSSLLVHSPDDCKPRASAESPTWVASSAVFLDCQLGARSRVKQLDHEVSPYRMLVKQSVAFSKMPQC